MNSVLTLSRIFLLPAVMLISGTVNAQTDTTMIGDMVYRNYLEKNRFWGNSWYNAAAYGYTHQKKHFMQLDVGRTFGKTEFVPKLGDRVRLLSWGLGYTFAVANREPEHHIRVFGEATTSLLLGWGLRVQYEYDFTNNRHYLIPEAGFSYDWIDVHYTYAWLLQKEMRHPYQHGIVVRGKMFYFVRKWQNSISKDYYEGFRGQ